MFKYCTYNNNVFCESDWKLFFRNAVKTESRLFCCLVILLIAISKSWFCKCIHFPSSRTAISFQSVISSIILLTPYLFIFFILLFLPLTHTIYNSGIHIIVFIAGIICVYNYKAFGGCYKRNVISGLCSYTWQSRVWLDRRKLISRILNDIYMKKRRAFCNVIS